MRVLGGFGVVFVAHAFFAFTDWRFFSLAIGLTLVCASFDGLIEQAALDAKA